MILSHRLRRVSSAVFGETQVFLRLLVDRDRTSTGHCHYGLHCPSSEGELCCLRSGVLKGNHVVVSFFFLDVTPIWGFMIQFEEHVFFQMGGLKPPISETTSLKLRKLWTHQLSAEKRESERFCVRGFHKYDII